MSSVVVDTSVIMACINQEPGGEILTDPKLDLVISSVILAETIGVLVRGGDSLRGARKSLEIFEFAIVDFDRRLAEEAGAMIAQTKALGLSLADRACLALAAREKLPALTADRAWQSVKVGVQVQLIR
jgi:ribonuclease VapC